MDNGQLTIGKSVLRMEFGGRAMLAPTEKFDLAYGIRGMRIATGLKALAMTEET